MKRTDKYRDSYQYDNQNQQHRRQSEDASYRQQNAKTILRNILSVIITVEIIVENKCSKKKMKNLVAQKMVIRYYCHSINCSRYFCYTRFI